jgi:aryl-alcohol dehydrogenase-like predicted oxidoreductase
MQNRYNLVNREDERELIPLCRGLGVGVIPYSPLARGLLARTRERTGEARTVRGAAAIGLREQEGPASLPIVMTAVTLGRESRSAERSPN